MRIGTAVISHITFHACNVNMASDEASKKRVRCHRHCSPVEAVFLYHLMWVAVVVL